jgi:hypothetical protein
MEPQAVAALNGNQRNHGGPCPPRVVTAAMESDSAASAVLLNMAPRSTEAENDDFCDMGTATMTSLVSGEHAPWTTTRNSRLESQADAQSKAD